MPIVARALLSLTLERNLGRYAAFTKNVGEGAVRFVLTPSPRAAS